jgi:hypothetical protein
MVAFWSSAASVLLARAVSVTATDAAPPFSPSVWGIRSMPVTIGSNLFSPLHIAMFRLANSGFLPSGRRQLRFAGALQGASRIFTHSGERSLMRICALSKVTSFPRKRESTDVGAPSAAATWVGIFVPRVGQRPMKTLSKVTSFQRPVAQRLWAVGRKRESSSFC